MKLVISPEAALRLEMQVQYLRDQHAPDAAERLRVRVLRFLDQHLARFPRAGRQVENHDAKLWEMWIPRTQLVVWYEINAETITILSVWHASQDRRTPGLNET